MIIIHSQEVHGILPYHLQFLGQGLPKHAILLQDRNQFLWEMSLEGRLQEEIVFEIFRKLSCSHILFTIRAGISRCQIKHYAYPAALPAASRITEGFDGFG